MKRAPKWKPDRWAARYRGLLLSCESFWNAAPRFRWEVIGNVGDLSGRARTLAQAMACAQSAADIALAAKEKK